MNSKTSQEHPQKNRNNHNILQGSHSNKKKLIIIGPEPPWDVSNGWSWYAPSTSNFIKVLSERFSIEQIDVKDIELWLKNNHIDINHNITGALFQHKYAKQEDQPKLASLKNHLKEKGINNIINDPINNHLFYSKSSFYESLSKKSSVLIPTQVVRNFDDLEIAVNKFGYPLVLRPDSLSGGKGVKKITNINDARKTLCIFNNKYTNNKKVSYLERLFRKNISFENSESHNNLFPVVSPFINSWNQKLQCFTNAAAYFWNGKLWYANARLSKKSFNIHADSGLNELARTESAIKQVLLLIAQYKSELERLACELGEWSLRMDIIIDLNKNKVWVCEPEIKGGPGEIMRDTIYPELLKLGWDYHRVREVLGVTAQPDYSELIKRLEE